MDERVFVIGQSHGLHFAFEPRPAADSKLAPLAWGGLRAWVGDTLIWSQQGSEDEAPDGQPVEWTWVELLGGLARIWPWLVLEEGYPLPVSPEHPGLLAQEAQKRWEDLAEGERDAEEEALFDFRHRHDLSLLLRGIFLPALWLVREGNECVIWSNVLPHPVRQPQAEVLACLTELADRLAASVDEGDARAEQALRRWQGREAVVEEHFFEVASGLSREELTALMDGHVADSAALAAFFDVPVLPTSEPVYHDSEILAAARMTAGYLDITAQRCALEAIRQLPQLELPMLERLSDNAPVPEPSQKGFEQGYQLAQWLRAELGLAADAVSDPEALLQQWGVTILETELDPSLDALAAWGRRHGPGIVINSHPEAWTSSPNRRRTTMAHEICHLLVDRHRSLPVAEVLGGQAPRLAEQRANAFAAEFLLPRDTAARLCRNHTDILDAARALEARFQVSREVVRHQINNSSLGETLSRQERTRLASWGVRHCRY